MTLVPSAGISLTSGHSPVLSHLLPAMNTASGPGGISGTGSSKNPFFECNNSRQGPDIAVDYLAEHGETTAHEVAWQEMKSPVAQDHPGHFLTALVLGYPQGKSFGVKTIVG
jgi:hypothetical protein